MPSVIQKGHFYDADIFLIKSRRFTCFNVQHKHNLLVDPKRTVVHASYSQKTQTINHKYEKMYDEKSKLELDFSCLTSRASSLWCPKKSSVWCEMPVRKSFDETKNRTENTKKEKRSGHVPQRIV